jgi:nitrogen fixation-related uncharacterized protein
MGTVAPEKLLKYLIPVSWVLLGILFMALLWGLAMALFEEEHAPDPNAEDPLTGMTPMADAGAQPEVVRLLTEAGADIDQLLPGGESMLVRFISMQHWDSALYLIQRGANLDVTNPDGLSVDFYLKEFSDSVYGQHPEGWARVRQGIQARRQ